MDQWSIVDFFGTEGAIELRIRQSLIFWGRVGREGSSEHCQGSLERYRFVGTEDGLAVREQNIIGSLCYFLFL